MIDILLALHWDWYLIGLRRIIDNLLALDVWLISYWFETYDWYFIGLRRMSDILLGLDVWLIFDWF